MTDQLKNPVQKHQILLELSAGTVFGAIALLLLCVPIISAITYYSAISEAKVSICKAIATRSVQNTDQGEIFKSLQKCLDVAN